MEVLNGGPVGRVCEESQNRESLESLNRGSLWRISVKVSVEILYGASVWSVCAESLCGEFL